MPLRSILQAYYKYFAKDIQRVPLLRCLIAYCCGIFLSSVVRLPSSIYFFVAFIVALICLLLNISRQSPTLSRIVKITVFIATMLFGMVYCPLRQGEWLNEYGRARISGQIAEDYRIYDKGKSVVFNADTIEINNCLITNCKGIVFLDSTNVNVNPGCNIAFEGEIKTPRQYLFSMLNYAEYLSQKNYQFMATADTIVERPANRYTVAYWVGTARSWVKERLISTGVDKSHAGFLMALMMGDRSGITPAMKVEFSSGGIIHILAVSGMHVGIIYAALCLLIGWRRKQRSPWQAYIIVIILWVYAIICGLSPSAMRATIMMSIFEIGSAKLRRSDSQNTMVVAAFVILLYDPLNLFSIGFYLSFCAVWGLISFLPPLQLRYELKNLSDKEEISGKILDKLKKGTVSIVLVSTIAQIATAPVSLYCFHRFPTYFLPTNIVVVTSLPIIIFTAIATLIFGGIVNVALIMNTMLDMMFSFVSLISSLPFSVINDIDFSFAETIFALLTLYSLSWTISQVSAGVLESTQIKVVFFSFFLMFMSGIYAEFTKNRATHLIVYETYGNVNVVAATKGEAYCFIADTAQNTAKRTVENIKTKFDLDSINIDLLRDKLQIETKNDTLYVAASQPSYPLSALSSIVICNDARPPETSDATTNIRNVVITSSALFRREWKDYCNKNGITLYDAASEPSWISGE